MKSIGMRFSIVVGVCAIAFSAQLLYLTWSSASAHMQDMQALQAELALEFDLAIRDCAAKAIHPLTSQSQGGDEFIVETMSTTFVAQRVFEKMRERFPRYIVKFSSVNPRNPENLAGPQEIKFLDYFRDHPEATRWNGTIELDGHKYLAYLNAVRIEESCLRCHGRLAESPPSVIDRYGVQGGFNYKVGDVAGMDMIAVPTDNVNAALLKDAYLHLLATAGWLVFMFGAIFITFQMIVSRRLAAITGHFQQVAEQSEDEPLAAVPVDGSDEISVLARSFNALTHRLQTLHESLENRVQNRTAELTRANQTLEEQIDERERLEREVHRIGARERQHIGQELHDGLGQELTGLSYLAASLHQKLRAKELPEVNVAAEVAEGIPSVLRQLKAIVRGMIPLELSADDLIPALQELLTNIEGQTGVRCRLESDPHARVADSDAAVQVFRIAQEAVSNAIKHGYASEIVVSLQVTNGHTELAVCDDGIGIRETATTAVGCGLQVMRHRARVIGGSLDVQGTDAKGTCVTCTIPTVAS
jgi:signal transduction histidine kinase